jgi:hypothetical protein
MIMEDWKIKIAALWLLHTSASLFVGFVMWMEPGVLEGIIAGEISGMQITPEVMLIVSIEFLVPFVMAFLTLTLKDSIFTGIALISAIESLTKQSAYSAYAVLMWLSIIVVTALVVWYAWKSKQEA